MVGNREPDARYVEIHEFHLLNIGVSNLDYRVRRIADNHFRHYFPPSIFVNIHP